jgi:hypothetical protein
LYPIKTSGSETNGFQTTGLLTKRE